MTKHLRFKRTILAVLALVGLYAAVNAVLVGVAHMNIQDTANQAAFTAATAVRNMPITPATADEARYRAAQYAADHGATLDGSVTLHDDGTVTVHIVQHATNLWLDRLPFAKTWVAVSATATSGGAT